MCLLSIYLHRDQCRLHCSASTSSSFEYQWGLWSFCEQKHNNLWWMLERVCFVYTACVHTWKCPWFNSVSVRASVQQMLDRWALNLIHITHICHFLFSTLYICRCTEHTENLRLIHLPYRKQGCAVSVRLLFCRWKASFTAMGGAVAA